MILLNRDKQAEVSFGPHDGVQNDVVVNPSSVDLTRGIEVRQYLVSIADPTQGGI